MKFCGRVVHAMKVLSASGTLRMKHGRSLIIKLWMEATFQGFLCEVIAPREFAFNENCIDLYRNWFIIMLEFLSLQSIKNYVRNFKTFMAESSLMSLSINRNQSCIFWMEIFGFRQLLLFAWLISIFKSYGESTQKCKSTYSNCTVVG